MTLAEDLDKRLDRVRKLLAHAARTENTHEAILAAERVVAYLDAHPLPIRWFVPVGATLRVVPLDALRSRSDAVNRLRVVTTRGDNWFFESHRVKNDSAANALRAGYLYFERNAYAVLVHAGAVDAFI